MVPSGGGVSREKASDLGQGRHIITMMLLRKLRFDGPDPGLNRSDSLTSEVTHETIMRTGLSVRREAANHEKLA